MHRYRRRTRIAQVSIIATGTAVSVIAVAACAARPATISAVIASATSIAPHPAGSGYQSTVSYAVNTPVEKLVVDGQAGDITVTDSERTSTQIVEVVRYAKTAPKLIHTLTGTMLNLGYTCPSSENCSVSFDIRVPSNTAVQITEGAGAIDLTGIGGNISAADRIGSIRALYLTSRAATLRTGSGEIFAGFTATPDSIQASTGAGLVSIGVPPTVYYNVTARTQAEATVNVPTRITSRHTINLSDGAGDIVVVMGYPAASNAAGMQNVNWPSWATRGT
jgi:hypothetical protein